ncbi:hypothetical protein HPNQ4044_0696 [Helicobacter pylori NQ4044]|uniref:Uncharacterized protein n=1 Tax=Helicobacter pylori NQ4044 TaxID=992028 RepID=I9QVC3_HELPX|nr:hypothetical protein HPNQ4044_0696 [Helicobacter pylori NQ4044]
MTLKKHLIQLPHPFKSCFFKNSSKGFLNFSFLKTTFVFSFH